MKAIEFEELIEAIIEKIKLENNNIAEIKNIDTKSILKQLEEFRKIVDSEKRIVNKEFEKEYKYEYKIAELFLIQTCFLFYAFDTNFGPMAKSKLKIKTTNPELNQALKTISILLHQVNNNLNVFIQLLKDGYNFQANLIFRNLIEQTSIILAIILDLDFHIKYIDNALIENQKEKVTHWYKNISPKKIDNIIKKGYLEFEKLADQNDIFEIKEILYSDTSEYVHSNFHATTKSSFTSKKDGDNLLNQNVFGRVDSNIEIVFINTLTYLQLFIRDFSFILKTKHNISIRNLNNGNEFIFLNFLTKHILIKLIKNYTAANNGLH